MPRYRTMVLLPDSDACLSAAAFTNRDLQHQIGVVDRILGELAWDNPDKIDIRAPVAIWSGNEGDLAAYGNVLLAEAASRGIPERRGLRHLRGYAGVFFAPGGKLPFWWGDTRLHAGHRAHLLQRDREAYAARFPNTDPAAPLWWPLARVTVVGDGTNAVHVIGRCLACGDNPEGCGYCHKYRCATCNIWRPWEFGSGDSPACDACWCEARR